LMLSKSSLTRFSWSIAERACDEILLALVEMSMYADAMCYLLSTLIKVPPLLLLNPIIVLMSSLRCKLRLR
jgi:hypothetical protein